MGSITTQLRGLITKPTTGTFFLFLNYLFHQKESSSTHQKHQNGLPFNHFAHKPWFLCVCSKSFENTVEIGEIAHKQFLLFPQHFPPFWGTFRHNHQFLNCGLQTISVWKSLKFVVWERVKKSRYGYFGHFGVQFV